VLNVAVAEGWIPKNPFNAGGQPLISTADERKRERIVSRSEEAALLEACELVDKSGRQSCLHLRPILIMALDSAMRFGELRTLRWRDVDLEEKLITIQAFNTKTMKSRTISMTTRLADELAGLWEKSPKESDMLVFGILSSVKKAFARVCDKAKVEGLRFHDLRHTAATRLVEGHLPLQEVSRILGHQTPQMTYRYVNADSATARRAAAVLDALNARAHEAAQVQSEAVN
jgi:integrase